MWVIFTLYKAINFYGLKDRDGALATRLAAHDKFPVLPFEFTIELPAPNYQTVKGCRTVPLAA